MKTSKANLKWIPAHHIDADGIGKLLHERAWCYFIPPQHGADGFIPACVIEKVQGYRMMSGNGEGARPWYWGDTFEKAQATCDDANEKMGISKERALEIVQSSMADFDSLPKRRAIAGNYPLPDEMGADCR